MVVFDDDGSRSNDLGLSCTPPTKPAARPQVRCSWLHGGDGLSTSCLTSGVATDDDCLRTMVNTVNSWSRPPDRPLSREKAPCGPGLVVVRLHSAEAYQPNRHSWVTSRGSIRLPGLGGESPSGDRVGAHDRDRLARARPNLLRFFRFVRYDRFPRSRGVDAGN